MALWDAPLLMQLVCTESSMPHWIAEPWMSCSFFTVSLPMCSSLLTWSSTLGISTLPAVRVRRVATWHSRVQGLAAVQTLLETHRLQLQKG